MSVRVGGYEVIDNVIGSPIDVDAFNELIRLGLIKPITAQTAMDVVLLIQNRAAFPLVFECSRVDCSESRRSDHDACSREDLARGV